MGIPDILIEIRQLQPSTDNALVRWDGTAGFVIQDSNAILDDDGNLVLNSGLTVGTDANVTGDVSATSGIFSGDIHATDHHINCGHFYLFRN